MDSFESRRLTSERSSSRSTDDGPGDAVDSSRSAARDSLAAGGMRSGTGSIRSSRGKWSGGGCLDRESRATAGACDSSSRRARWIDEGPALGAARVEARAR